MASAPENHNILFDIADKLDVIIEQLYGDGKRLFLTGMAEGFDTIAGQAVMRAKVKHDDIKLIAVVPFPAQSAKCQLPHNYQYFLNSNCSDFSSS